MSCVRQVLGLLALWDYWPMQNARDLQSPTAPVGPGSCANLAIQGQKQEGSVSSARSGDLPDGLMRRWGPYTQELEKQKSEGHSWQGQLLN